MNLKDLVVSLGCVVSICGCGGGGNGVVDPGAISGSRTNIVPFNLSQEAVSNLDISSCNQTSINNAGSVLFECRQQSGAGGLQEVVVRDVAGGIRRVATSYFTLQATRLLDDGSVVGAFGANLDAYFQRIDASGAITLPLGDVSDLSIGDGTLRISTDGNFVVIPDGNPSGVNLFFNRGVSSPLWPYDSVKNDLVNSQGVVVGVTRSAVNDSNIPFSTADRFFVRAADGTRADFRTPDGILFEVITLTDSGNLLGTQYPSANHDQSTPLFYSLAEQRNIDLGPAIPPDTFLLLAEATNGLLIGETTDGKPFATRRGGSPVFLDELLPPESGWSDLRPQQLSSSGRYLSGYGEFRGSSEAFLIDFGS